MSYHDGIAALLRVIDDICEGHEPMRGCSLCELLLAAKPLREPERSDRQSPIPDPHAKGGMVAKWADMFAECSCDISDRMVPGCDLHPIRAAGKPWCPIVQPATPERPGSARGED